MNAAQLKSVIVRLAFRAFVYRDPAPDELKNWVTNMHDDLSNADVLVAQIAESVESVSTLALLRGLVANARQSIATLKTLLA